MLNPQPPTSIIMNTTEPITLTRRTTRKYSAGWSHLDDSKNVGTARVLSSSIVDRDKFGEYRVQTLILRVRSTCPPDEVRDAIHDTLTSGCRCEHDCCGHVQTSVHRTRKTPRGNLWVVKLGLSRNI